MLNKYIFLIFIIIGSQYFLRAQINNNVVAKLPSITLKNINGKSINLSEISNNNKPILICFWKTCCKKPGQYLDAINEIYGELVGESNLTLYAIAIDDSRTTNQVRPLLKAMTGNLKYYST